VNTTAVRLITITKVAPEDNPHSTEAIHHAEVVTEETEEAIKHASQVTFQIRHVSIVVRKAT